MLTILGGTWRIRAAALAALLFVGVFALDGGRAGSGGAVVQGPGEPRPQVPAAQAALAGPATSTTSRSALNVPPSIGPRSPTQSEGDPTPGLVGDLAGVVLDAGGQPIAGAHVYLDVAGSDSIRGALSARGRARPDLSFPATHIAATTDTTGAFLFAGVSPADGGDLRVTADDFPDYIRHHTIETSALLQTVRFPEPLACDCVWIVEVVDTHGEPLFAESADVRFLGHTVRNVVRLGRRDAPRIERGRVTFDALPPGRWEARVDVPTTFGGLIACRIEGPRSQLTSQLVLERHTGGVRESTVELSPFDGLPWIDGTSALGRWAQARRGLGGDTSNQDFVTTLRCGFGPVTGAELVLKLRGLKGMPMDDTVSLELGSEGTFRWHANIAPFAGGWSSGARTTLRLDLARLPVGGAFGNDTLSLLTELADGLLDVVVQNDTAVDAITLRVAR